MPRRNETQESEVTAGPPTILLYSLLNSISWTRLRPSSNKTYHEVLHRLYFYSPFKAKCCRAPKFFGNNVLLKLKFAWASAPEASVICTTYCLLPCKRSFSTIQLNYFDWIKAKSSILGVKKNFVFFVNFPLFLRKTQKSDQTLLILVYFKQSTIFLAS